MNAPHIMLHGVSKFYGEVLGVHDVTMDIGAGITSLVGPNGAGKTTLLNLVAGLLRPTQGEIRVMGHSATHPEQYCRMMGYCTQHDAFPKGITGIHFMRTFLSFHGYSDTETNDIAWEALTQIGLAEAANRKAESYSKGMRQRLKLALAIAHKPKVLLLDEPLNGLDPMARADLIDRLRKLAADDVAVVVSSHVLHEVDLISDRVVLVHQGYVVAEGGIQNLREEVSDQPLQILVRCDRPSLLASRLFEMDHLVEVRMHTDQKGLLLRTRNASVFYDLMNRVALSENLRIETIQPVDDNVQSLYDYLIGTDEGGRS